MKRLSRTPHYLIERRYRNKLQVEFDNLASKIPDGEMIDVDNAEQSLKGRSKASAIAAAAKHIETLERENESKAMFVRALQEQIEDLQKLVNCDDCPVLRCL
jgi:23S rRNA G2069 N7-methylase RlmK/C1962 C5-methylase RlmI